MEGESFLILLGVILLLIILVIRFRKAIKILIIRMIYGQYSYEFVSQYKNSYIRSPFQYCFRDEFVSHLLFVLSKKENIPTYSTLKDIFFENTFYMVDYKDFLRSKGTPYCFNAYNFQNPGFEIKAIGYQAMIAGSQAITVFYFMNDSFFMGEYIFKNPQSNIKASLSDHFLNIKNVAEDNFYIENTKNRIIHYQDSGFSVDIKYLCREDKDIIDNLLNYHTHITEKKIHFED